MKNIKNRVGVLGLLLVLILVCFLNFRTTREKRLINEGSELIIKIEAYRAKHSKLPNSLEDIGLKEDDGIDVLYYSKKDSTHYIIWFGMDLGESITYYSDSKQWEDKDRGMK